MTEETVKRLIEVNGIKMELDERTATLKNIETFRIGSLVKVLIKEYNGKYTSHPGMIVSFDNFSTRPSINVVYMKSDFGSSSLSHVTIHSPSPADVEDGTAKEQPEITLAGDYEFHMKEEDVLKSMDRKIADAEMEVTKAKSERQYFVDLFGRAFPEIRQIDAESRKDPAPTTDD